MKVRLVMLASENTAFQAMVLVWRLRHANSSLTTFQPSHSRPVAPLVASTPPRPSVVGAT